MNHHTMNFQPYGFRNIRARIVRRYRKRVACWLLSMVIPLYASPTVALDLYWKCGDGDRWDSFGVPGGCWATFPGGTPSVTAPADSDIVYLTQSSSTDMTVSYWDPDPAASLVFLTIDAIGAGNMTLQSINVHDLNTTTEYIGFNGTGAIIWDQGKNAVTDTLILGHNTTGKGTYNLSGTGTLSVGGDEFIGLNGTGTFTQSGGTHTVTSSLSLGDSSTGNGTYNLSGTGTLSVGGDEFIGLNGTGTFTQSGGTHTVTSSLSLGDSSTGNGTYNLSGTGTLSVGLFEFIGLYGTGTFTQSGGTHTVADSLILGSNMSNGTYDLFGTGTLSATNEYIGYNSTSTFTQNGGSNTVSNSLILGETSTGNGTYNLSGTGSLSAGGELIGRGGTGTFTQTGGSHTVTTDLYLGDFSTGNGTYNLSGTGSLSVAGAEYIGFAGTGTFAQTGGSNTVTGTLYLGENSTGNGTYNLSGTGALSAVDEIIGFLGTGTFTQTDGSHTVTDTLYLAYHSTSNGTYNLNGGILNVGGLIQYGDGTGTFNFNGGTLNMLNNLTISNTGPLAGQTLSGARTLSVGGTTTLDSGSTLTLDGGSFSTGSLVSNGFFDFQRGTFNLTGDNLTIGSGGLFGPLALLDFSKEITVTNNTTIDSGAVLLLDNGRLSSGTVINNGTIALDGPVSTLSGGVLTNNNLVTGNGHITAQLNNAAGSEIRVLGGELLTFTAASNSNQGDISLLGGTVEFNQDLTNTTGGIISGTGNLIATSGLTNQGTVALSGGTTGVAGDVTNATGGTIIVSGNGTATFFDDVVHDGAEFRVSNGSSAVFFGSVSGAGAYTGTGALFFEGDLRPGSSPGLIGVEGDMHLGLSAHSIMEIAGLARGTEYDAFDIGGNLSLGGELAVSLYDPGSGLFAPQLGDSFDLFLADTITDNFDLLTMASLDGGLGWQLDVLTDAIGLTDVVRLSVVTSAVPVPPSVWLFGSGLLGLMAIARRRRAACVPTRIKE